VLLSETFDKIYALLEWNRNLQGWTWKLDFEKKTELMEIEILESLPRQNQETDPGSRRSMKILN
jgi:hypothetical protein